MSRIGNQILIIPTGVEITKNDITIGNKILDNIIENIKENRSEELLNLLAITLNKIEQRYPQLF